LSSFEDNAGDSPTPLNSPRARKCASSSFSSVILLQKHIALL
jgi:hypothetical protein